MTVHADSWWEKIPHAACRLITTEDDHRYYALGSESLAPIPDHQSIPFDPLPKPAPDPTYYLDRHWSSNFALWQAFLPREIDRACQCELFDCLVFTRESLVLSPHGKHDWCLSQGLVDRFYTLEWVLCSLRASFLDHIPFLNVSYTSFPIQHYNLYGRAYPTRIRTIHRAIRSRSALLLLAAEVSFLYACIKHSSLVTTVDWRSMIAKHGLPLHILDFVELSWLFHPGLAFQMHDLATEWYVNRTERVGAFVHMSACDWVALFYIFHNAHVPLWLYFGTGCDPLKNPLVRLHPSDVLVSSRQQHPSAPAPRHIMTHHSKPTIPRPSFGFPSSCMPPVNLVHVSSLEEVARVTEDIYEPTLPGEIASCQLVGETWSAFFARRALMIESDLRATESLHSRDIRLRREQHSLLQLIPETPSCSTRVFIWETGPSGYLVRNHVPSVFMSHYWYSFSPSQRVYCPWTDEWDLVDEIDPNVDLSTSNDDLADVGEDSLQNEIINPSAGGVAPGEGSDRLPPSSVPYMPAKPPLITEPSTVNDIVCSTVAVISPDSLLSLRFGMTLPDASVATVCDESRWKAALRCTGCFRYDDALLPVNQVVFAEATELLVNISKIPDTFLYRFRTWCDMHPDNLAFIRQRPFSFRVAKAVLGSYGPVCELLPIHASSPLSYRLFLFKVTDVLHVLRLSCDNLDAVVLYMAKYGIRYCRCISFPVPEASSIIPHIPRYIPIRPYGYQPDASEFFNYHRRCRSLLRNPRIARAALARGGIVWRIALEHTSLSWAHSFPDPRDLVSYGLFHSSDRGDTQIVEEPLTDEHVYILCGVYRVERSYRAKSNEITENFSWFPLPSIWEQSGLDLGVWTADVESWFRDRVKAHIAGPVVIRNQTDWRQALRGVRRLGELRKSVDGYGSSCLFV